MNKYLSQVKQWYLGPLPEEDMDYFTILMAIDRQVEVINICKVLYTVTAEWNQNIRKAKTVEWIRRRYIFNQYLIAELKLDSKRSKKYLSWFHNCMDEYERSKEEYFRKICDTSKYFVMLK